MGNLIKFRGGIRWIAINFVIPVLSGWMLASIVHSRIRPSETRDIAPIGHSYGAVRMKIRLPGTSEGIPEPLLTCGRADIGTLVYLRIVGKNQAKIGVQFLGLRVDESGPFPLPAMDAVLSITCYFPAFFPKEGDPYWGEMSERLQKIRRTQYLITVNGIVRLKGLLVYSQPDHEPIYLCQNPIGGGVVSDLFTGALISAQQ